MKKNSIFIDEQQLQSFLSLSESGKEEFIPGLYYAQQGAVLDCLHFIWNVDRDFNGEYITDYKLISNKVIQNKSTSWKDKYTTSLYSRLSVNCRTFALQFIPVDGTKLVKCIIYPRIEERVLL